VISPYLTAEHGALRAMVREFAEKEIEPHAERWDAEHTFPVDVVTAMGDLGLFGIPFPEPYGAGGDFLSVCIAIEEIARVDQSLAITLEAGVGLGANPIAKFGSESSANSGCPTCAPGVRSAPSASPSPMPAATPAAPAPPPDSTGTSG